MVITTQFAKLLDNRKEQPHFSEEPGYISFLLSSMGAVNHWQVLPFRYLSSLKSWKICHICISRFSFFPVWNIVPFTLLCTICKAVGVIL